MDRMPPIGQSSFNTSYSNWASEKLRWPRIHGRMQTSGITKNRNICFLNQSIKADEEKLILLSLKKTTQNMFHLLIHRSLRQVSIFFQKSLILL